MTWEEVSGTVFDMMFCLQKHVFSSFCGYRGVFLEQHFFLSFFVSIMFFPPSVNIYWQIPSSQMKMK